MSERGYSPAMSSLNHSYETLNMSETYHHHNNNSGGGPLQSGEPSTGTIQRRPHRPAPPVPVNEQFESSKATLFPKKSIQQQILEHQVGVGVLPLALDLSSHNCILPLNLNSRDEP